VQDDGIAFRDVIEQRHGPGTLLVIESACSRALLNQRSVAAAEVPPHRVARDPECTRDQVRATRGRARAHATWLAELA
jgi:hypothetical protein